MGLLMLDGQQHRTAGNRWDTKKDQDWSFALEISSKVCASNSCNNLNSSEGDVEQNCLEWVKTKRAYNERSKGGNAAARYSDSVRKISLE